MSTKEPSDTIVLRIDAIKTRLEVSPKLNPYCTAQGGVVELSGPFPMDKAKAAVEFIRNAQDDLGWCLNHIEALENELRVRREAEEKTAPHNWCDECLDYVDMQIEKRGEGVQADYIGTCPICGHKNFW